MLQLYSRDHDYDTLYIRDCMYAVASSDWSLLGGLTIMFIVPGAHANYLSLWGVCSRPGGGSSSSVYKSKLHN